MARSDPSPFAEAAERLGALVREVKQKQFDRTGIKAIPVEEPAALHPEEAWARRFAIHSFRPHRDQAGRPPLSGFVSPPADMPKMPVFRESAVEPSLDQKQGPAGNHIGALLGKAGPKRSLLRRLFRGRAI